MKFESLQPTIKKDINITPNPKVYPLATEVILDSKINASNLQRLGKKKEWLFQELQNKGIQNINQVFFAEVLPNAALYVDKHDDPSS